MNCHEIADVYSSQLQSCSERQLGNGRVRQGLVALSKIATKTMLILITESYPVGKTYTL